MPTYPNIGLITPVLGGDAGVWDDKVTACFALIDAHDHSSGKGLAINSDAITIDADLSFAGYTISSLGKISFTAITAPASGSKNLFVSSADNELYWRTNSGTNVKLTSGTSINVSLAGGIAGDYASVGAVVSFDDSNNVYTLKDQSAKWMRVSHGPLRIYEYNTTESVYLEQIVDAALASSYTVTWPAALPGSTALMQITSAGVVSFTNTIVESITLAAGKSVAVSTTGKYKHDGRTVYAPALPSLASVTAGTVTGTVGFPRAEFAISTTAYLPVLVPLDEDASVYTVTLVFNAAVSSGVVARLYSGNSGAFSYLSVTTAGSGSSSIVLDCSGSPISASGTTFWIRIVTDGATTCQLGQIAVTHKVE